MLPPRQLLADPFCGTPRPLLAQVRDVLQAAARRPVRLELVLRAIMTPEDAGDDLLADGALEVVHALLDEPDAFGLDAVRLWPQLPGSEGVWLSAATMADFFDRLEPLLERAFARGVPALLYDLEPPRDVLDALLGRRGRDQARGELTALARRLMRTRPEPRFDEAARDLAQHLARVRALAPSRAADWQPHLTAAVAPIGTGVVRHLAERALMTPTRAPHDGRTLFDGLEAMCYGSLLGYAIDSEPLRAAAGVAVVAAAARTHVRYCRKQGVAAGVLLGCTGVGLLGDEPVYASPAALARDARAAGAARLQRVGVYNLRGLLFADADPQVDGVREDWPAWVAALVGCAPRSATRARSR